MYEMRPYYGRGYIIIYYKIGFFTLFVHFIKLTVKTQMSSKYGPKVFPLQLKYKTKCSDNIK